MITAWEDLDQAGLISTLLPGWERLRSMPQRDPIHLYTADRHLMQTAVNASTLVRRVSRPDLLLLAAIFHDIGKGSATAIIQSSAPQWWCPGCAGWVSRNRTSSHHRDAGPAPPAAG